MSDGFVVISFSPLLSVDFKSFEIINLAAKLMDAICLRTKFDFFFFCNATSLN